MDYRERTFERYVSTQLQAVNQYVFQRDYDLFARYCRKNYLPLLPENRKTEVLDVGCGMGRFLHFLKAAGFQNSLGIDTSDEAVRVCRERGFRAEHEDAISHIKRHSETYGAIVMNDVVEHLTKPELFDLIDAARTALKPGGALIIKTPNAANPLMGSHSLAMDITHEIPFSEESLSQLLNVFEFDDVRVLPSNIYVKMHNPAYWVARAAAACLNLIWRALYTLYGRPGTRIFSKHLLAVGVKPR